MGAEAMFVYAICHTMERVKSHAVINLCYKISAIPKCQHAKCNESSALFNKHAVSKQSLLYILLHCV